MFGGKKILAVIPAREGSKRLPGKNLMPFAGQSLLARTILVAKNSRYLDELIVSTDAKDIAKEAKRHGCAVPFIRPERFSQDDSSSVDVLLHALSELPPYDYVVLLQPTSPLRKSEDIDIAIEKCINQELDSCCSVSKIHYKSSWLYIKNDQAQFSRLVARGGCEKDVFTLNGAVYVTAFDYLKEAKQILSRANGGFFEMPEWRSADIDTSLDFLTAESLFLSKKEGFDEEK